MNTSDQRQHDAEPGGETLSPRKQAFLENSEARAATRDRRIARNGYYYGNDLRYMQSIVPLGMDVLDLGCGTGHLLQGLRPGRGVGVDLSPSMIEVAREKLPDFEFHVGDVEDVSVLERIEGTFDYILLSDTLSFLEDCEDTLLLLHRFCRRDTRLVIAQYSSAWEPLLTVGEWLGMKARQPEQNWLSTGDIVALCKLADFDTVAVDWKQLVPKRLLGMGWLINRLFSNFPFIRRLCLRHYVVARSVRRRRMAEPPSLSIVIPCRNERGNVEQAVLRTPIMSEQQELIFVEGHSQDGTWDEILRVQAAYPDLRIRSMQQTGKGKADAVWAAFDAAEGELLMILDADLTVPPETLPKFYRAIRDGRGEYAMGTRMVYPVAQDAMRFLNYWANRTFAILFSWLLRQRITDTLCGTKVLTRASYERLRRENTLGEEDPFGDFDLILGAARQYLAIVEIPIRYASRDYGETQISRFRHGLMLARMVFNIYRKL
ncbi:MAG: bifunctional class I SAM-dependent methyltransferase/glycosyltransferase family 2 protein [Thermoanaerobaculia bacterium]|nr:bifunctional class I SAM-dependent methyltransferase/glycosyltransferase family 2 protein [Thermoanaerobaculia bacterium]